MKSCWFYHNYEEIKNFQVLHIHGKKVRAPESRTIVAVLKCSDCEATKEVFLKEVNSNIVHREIEILNKYLKINKETSITSTFSVKERKK